MFSFLFGDGIKLENPVALLGQDYLKVERKIYSSSKYDTYGLDIDALVYFKAKYADPKLTMHPKSDVRIFNFVSENDDNKIVKAGKIYIDEDESFINEVIKDVISYNKKIEEGLYRHNDDVCFEIEKDYNPDFDWWEARVTYSKMTLKKKKNNKKCNTRKEIKSDIRKFLD